MLHARTRWLQLPVGNVSSKEAFLIGAVNSHVNDIKMSYSITSTQEQKNPQRCVIMVYWSLFFQIFIHL